MTDLLGGVGEPVGDKPPPSPVSAEGHRQRIRARLLAAGPESVADHELLELVLFLALPRRDTKPIARALLARFGSFANAISAPLADLRGVDGMGEAGAAALKTVQAAALRLARAEVQDRPVLSHWDGLVAYLTATMARERVEQFRVLFLDAKNRLIADEAQSKGTVNHTPARGGQAGARVACERADPGAQSPHSTFLEHVRSRSGTLKHKRF